jgi:phosphotransferase system IIB component
MIILVSGAKKNIGDFIITHSATRLLAHLKNEKIVKLPNWESLDNHLELVNKTRALVVAGGPGFRPNMYGGVYPLFSDPEKPTKLGKPIYFLGLGWKGDPGDAVDLRNYLFNRKTKDFIELNAQQLHFSARDVLSYQVLVQNGIEEPVLSGCPVWYEPEKIGQKFKRPVEIKKIVFTPPQKYMYYKQSQKALLKLRELYPKAIIYCAFHRGTASDNFTTAEEGERLQKYVKFAKSRGFIVKDVAYDLKKIDFYLDCDLHIGYRLHAHLYFLRIRKPSILIEEDGRGIGMSRTLGSPGIVAWRYTLPGLLTLIPMPRRLNLALRSRLTVISGQKDITRELGEYLGKNIIRTFEMSETALAVIDNTYPEMKKFVEAI